MAEHKVQPSSMLLIIQTISRGQTINNTVVCLKSITKNDSVNVIDANSWCGQKKLAGLSDISYNFECIHLQDPEGDKLSGTDLRVFAYQKLPIYYKIVPEVPQPGDEFEEGYGFISDISSSYSFDSVGTFSMTITAKGTPILYNADHFVRIGPQMWSNKNLEVTKFRNGIPIVEATDATNWYDLLETQTPAWAYWDFNSANASLGKYYNIYAFTSDNNLAPIGTKIPSWSDVFGTLQSTVYNQYPSNPGNAIMEASDEHWFDGSYNNFDAYGFGLQGNSFLLSGNDLKCIGGFGINEPDFSVYKFGFLQCEFSFNEILFNEGNRTTQDWGYNIRLLLDI